MAFSKQDGISGAGLNLISRGTVITGSISASASLRIEGEIKGKIVCHDNVTVGATGVVEGDVDAKSVIVGGKIFGNVTSQDRLILESQAGITGNIRAKRLLIEEGAFFDGKCSMKEIKDKPLTVVDKDMFEDTDAIRLNKAGS